MRVAKIMTRDVKSCSPKDTLHHVAQLMWENDFGCLPVVDQDRRPVAMITDRDICMATYTQGARLQDIRVAQAMSTSIYSCRAEDNLSEAEQIMRSHQVRRLPVIDREGKLVGLLSLNDIVLEAERERITKSARDVSDSELVRTLQAVSEHRLPVQA